MTNRRTMTILLLLATVLLGPACASKKGLDVTYHDPNMDFGLIQTIAVMPFGNLTTNRTAGEAVREVFMTMMQATEAAYVLPPGEVARGVSRLSLRNPDAPNAEEVVQFAEIVGADVVIVGTVLEYGELRSTGSAANVVSLSVKMFEAQTGKVVWSASASNGGIGATERLFGSGGKPMDEVTRKTVGQILDRLFGT